MTQEMTENIVTPSARRLIESLRDTGYTFTTSIADIIDNSVAADATDIRLSLYQKFGDLPVLLIADNGTGMDEKALESAMTYGSPKRPSPKSLGKFGMGLKTASTSFCRKLTVISKPEGATKYNCRQWDLDVVSAADKWILLEPKPEEYQEQITFLEEVTNGDKGTLIIWENIDRLVRPGSDTSMKTQLEHLTDKLREHLSGVFYNFLSKGGEYPDITITINDQPLEPWDPFCRWLNSPGATRVEVNPNELHYIMDTNGVEEKVGSFHVNVYLLPNSPELTPEELEKMRYKLDNQGFHIFREGRMISSGGWPNRLYVKDPHLNLIRVELSFTHELDDYFQIDIKKSRIDLPMDVRKQLTKILTPARNEANRRYRTGRSSKKEKSPLKEQHDRSGNAIDKHHDENTSSKVESVSNNGDAEIKNAYGRTKVKLVFDNSQDCVVQTRESLQDGVLWAPGLVEGNKHAVFLNESHDFYKKFYFAEKNNPTLIMAMDSVLWSLAEAELSVMNDNARRNLEDLRITVSRCLRTLSIELPEPEANDYEIEDEGGVR